MKKSLLLAATVALTLGASAQVSRPDSLVFRAFRTLQAKDTAGFIELYPNHQQMKKLMVNSMDQLREQLKAIQPNMNVDSMIKAEMENFTAEKYRNELQAEFSESFRRILARAQALNLDLSKATILSIRMDTAETEMTGILAVRGTLDLTSDGKDYLLIFDGAGYLPTENGWFGTKFTGIHRKGETAPAVEEVIQEGIKVDDEPPPPPPPPPPPAKKPVPVKKTPVKKTTPVKS